LSGSNVTQWNDKSGNGRNLVQATGANQPINEAVLLQGKNTIKFETNDFLRHSTAATWKFLHDGTQYLIAQVVRFGDAIDPNQYVYNVYTSTGSQEVGFYLLYDSRGGIVSRITHGVNRAVTPDSNTAVLNVSTDGIYPHGVFHVMSVVGRPSNATASERSTINTDFRTIDKNNSRTNAVSTADPSFAFSVGFSPNGTIQYVAEVIVVSGTNANETSAVMLMNYLNQKWNAYP
jgi:hypothetical protein